MLVLDKYYLKGHKYSSYQNKVSTRKIDVA